MGGKEKSDLKRPLLESELEVLRKRMGQSSLD